ncbi:hypothetical protein predicted by Glimmer/Critica [Sorangium cellulosum So ce56]|uniref:Uncharacterized protein n=1 Tax=Sorangium cellulosum (strain So ce56) TaxID=448385 RepID=A9GC72_SORC5|nr:hypothetical protein predicted by Glimmer/Critica [Sorangium cellulosum So ce56]
MHIESNLRPLYGDGTARPEIRRQALIASHEGPLSRRAQLLVVRVCSRSLDELPDCQILIQAVFRHALSPWWMRPRMQNADSVESPDCACAGRSPALY